MYEACVGVGRGGGCGGDGGGGRMTINGFRPSAFPVAGPCTVASWCARGAHEKDTHTRREVTQEPNTNPLWIDRQAGQGTGRQQLVRPIKTKQSWLFEG